MERGIGDEKHSRSGGNVREMEGTTGDECTDDGLGHKESWKMENAMASHITCTGVPNTGNLSLHAAIPADAPAPATGYETAVISPKVV